MQTMCKVHGRRGLAYDVGLGFYAFLRFHVDTSKYRRWNMDPAVASHCPPIIRPVDIASVGRPLTQPVANTLPPVTVETAPVSSVIDPIAPPPIEVTVPVLTPTDPLAPKN